MNLQIYNDIELLNIKAAEIIEKQLLKNPSSVLGLATGSTPVGVYKQLIRLYEMGKLDFQSVTTFNLDEYVGLPANHPCSYHDFMKINLFGSIALPEENIHIPNGMASDLEKECMEYEKAIGEKGGIDVQVLGIGHNGHIGFNEPGTPFESSTHVVNLTESTIQANARFFENPRQVPRQALSMGIKSIMGAKKIILLALGDAKSNIIFDALYGPVTTQVPASILQLHPDVTVFLDTAAARRIKEKDSSK